jgi:hypothetical protein
LLTSAFLFWQANLRAKKTFFWHLSHHLSRQSCMHWGDLKAFIIIWNSQKNRPFSLHDLNFWRVFSS